MGGGFGVGDDYRILIGKDIHQDYLIIAVIENAGVFIFDDGIFEIGS